MNDEMIADRVDIQVPFSDLKITKRIKLCFDVLLGRKVHFNLPKVTIKILGKVQNNSDML